MSKIFAKNKDVDVSRLRCILGWLAILLPWIVSILVGKIPASISATYYDPRSITSFMIILGASSILLIAYRGYELIDDIVNTVAGCFGLMICLFPCMMSGVDRVGTFQLPVKISSIIHNGSAVVFFGLLAFSSMFLFTKSSGEMTDKKKKRNIIYRVCAIGMVGSFALFLLPSFYIRTWLIETIALFFFGMSFLTKSNVYKFLFAEDEDE